LIMNAVSLLNLLLSCDGSKIRCRSAFCFFTAR
jgi:hypothetical protein